MYPSGTDIVDQLLFHHHPRVPDGVENLPKRDGRCRVGPDCPIALGKFRRHRVFQPEQPVGLKILAQTGRLDGGEPVMGVMQQMHVPPHDIAQIFKKPLGYGPDISTWSTLPPWAVF